MTMTSPHDRCRAAGLDDRDYLVLRRVAAGKQDHEIAEELGVKTSTVGRILSRIYQRLGLAGRVSAAMWLYGVATDA